MSPGGRGRAVRLLALGVAVLGSLLLAAPARAHDGPGGAIGLGLGLGAPTGLSLEMTATRSSSFEAALGVDAFHQTGAYGHLVYKLALARLARTPTVSVPFYLGVGGYVFDRDSQEDGLDLGVRVPMGVNFDFQRAPVQLFVELALGLDVIHTGPDGRDGFVGGYAGVRYWF